MTHLHRPLAAAGIALALSSLGGLAACDVKPAAASRVADDSRPGADPGTRFHYGPAIRLGAGRARAYVLVNERAGDRPIEMGLALDERALDSLPLPGSGHMGAHGEVHENILEMPKKNGTPFQFVELDWNPGGHIPPGVYDVPHFDFHFYTISKAQRDSIDPALPGYDARANELAAADLTPEHYGLPLPPGTPPVAAAVPRMGVHLMDMRSPELQGLLGNQAGYRPFTTTFIHGSWAGRVIFFEPMITRAYIAAKRAETDAAKRDEVIPLPKPRRYSPAGYYPDAYRIAWDAAAGEYRIALSGLQQRR
jgi:hypothetical protein